MHAFKDITWLETDSQSHSSSLVWGFLCCFHVLEVPILNEQDCLVVTFVCDIYPKLAMENKLNKGLHQTIQL